MPPFGSSDFNDGFFESLPPLELSKTPMAASTLFLEPLESLEAPEKFVLAFVDESGEPIRAATEADLVNLLEGDASKAPEAKQEEQSAALTEAEFKSLLRQPVCRHCGVTGGHQEYQPAQLPACWWGGWSLGSARWHSRVMNRVSGNCWYCRRCWLNSFMLNPIPRPMSSPCGDHHCHVPWRCTLLGPGGCLQG